MNEYSLLSRSLDIRPKEKPFVSAAFDGYVMKHSGGSRWHVSSWIDYSLAYTKGAIDRSVLIICDDSIVGVCPAVQCGECLGMGDDACAGPLLDADVDIEAVCNVLISYFKDCGIGSIDFRWDRYPFDCRAIIARIASCFNVNQYEWETAIVPLSLSKDEQFLRIRNSYRSLITKAKRKRSIVWGTAALFEHYRYCHQSVAKRPRPPETYEHQRRALESGSAFIVAATNEEHPYLMECYKKNKPEIRSILACNYVMVHKGHGYYASGPSIEKNLQHALQWAAMEILMGHLDGCSYELGWLKGDGIGFFKRGFGGSIAYVDAIKGSL